MWLFATSGIQWCIDEGPRMPEITFSVFDLFLPRCGHFPCGFALTVVRRGVFFPRFRTALVDKMLLEPRVGAKHGKPGIFQVVPTCCSNTGKPEWFQHSDFSSRKVSLLPICISLPHPPKPLQVTHRHTGKACEPTPEKVGRSAQSPRTGANSGTSLRSCARSDTL